MYKGCFRAFQCKLEICELRMFMIQILPFYLQKEVIFTVARKASFAGNKWKNIDLKTLKENFQNSVWTVLETCHSHFSSLY